MAKAFTGVKAALHQNHGLLTASRHSIEAAAFWFIALERCCQQQLDIAASGIEPIFIPRDRALYSREHVGSEYIGWLHFQTIWNKLIEDQPESDWIILPYQNEHTSGLSSKDLYVPGL